MSNKIRLINREDLVKEGLKVIIDSEEMVSFEGLEITQDIKECIQTILEADTEYKRIEHTKKIEEGMKKKGVKRGRLPLSNELQEEIFRLRSQGMTYEEIKRKLENENRYVSVKTINKYCKQQKGGEKDEDNK